MTQKILITGASAGFGKLITETFLNSGYAVAASMRNPQDRNEEVADTLSAAGAKIVELDVTDDTSVEKGVKNATEALGGLDVVINNAGIGVTGLQEGYTPDDFRALFDVNVFGVQRVCRAVLPHFRAQGSGLLLFTSSLLGRITLPFMGPYNASKWALEAMAENYRTELSKFNVGVALVEPGGFPTTFMDRLMKPSDTERLEEYGDFAGAPAGMLAGFEETLANTPEQNPQNVADAMLKLIETPASDRPFRTTVDALGMGEHVAKYNEHLAQITNGIYGALGIEGMLD